MAGRHRLEGNWWDCETSTVFATPLGLFVCSVRGAVGSTGRPINIGDVWTDEDAELERNLSSLWAAL